MENKQITIVSLVEQSLPTIETWVSNDPEYLNRFKVAVYYTVKKMPSIMNCEPDSIRLALNTMAQFKLLCGAKNECCLIPYGNQLTFQPMVAGFRKLAYATGLIKRIVADVIYEGDIFENDIPTAFIKHSRQFKSENVIASYCFVETYNNGNFIDVMSKKDIDNTRKKSKNSALWNDFYHEKCKITVTKRLLKTLTDIKGMEVIQDIIEVSNESDKMDFNEKNNQKADSLMSEFGQLPEPPKQEVIEPVENEKVIAEIDQDDLDPSFFDFASDPNFLNEQPIRGKK